MLKYDEMGRLWRVLEYERLLPDGDSECVAAREFRHASGRQRYLVRQLDPQTLAPIPEADVWSDYLGESIHGDYTLDGGDVTELTRYLPGHWQTDVQAATTSFFHTNMLGTTRMLTDDSGAMIPEASRLYTAFGDLVTPPPSAMTRYGYAGAWGYEGGPSLWGSGTYAPDFVHVGARYYSPTLGRFLQRDPIGIFGGLNVYAYVDNNPLTYIDPSGLDRYYHREPGHSLLYIDDGKGSYCHYGFGPGASDSMLPGVFKPIPGMITPRHLLPGEKPPSGARRFPSTPAQDSKDIERIERQRKNPPKYSFTGIGGTNCVGWAWHWATVRQPKPKPPKPMFYFCFVAGTYVHTENGFVPIEELARGAHVVSRDTDSRTTETSEVLAVLSGWTSDVFQIRLNEETIECTGEHPFWVIGRGWVRAGDLRCGDQLQDAAGNPVTILAVERRTLGNPVRVYNLTVGGQHTYSVGRHGGMVHNKPWP